MLSTVVEAIRLKVDLCSECSAESKKLFFFVEYLCDHVKIMLSLLAESSQQCI